MTQAPLTFCIKDQLMLLFGSACERPVVLYVQVVMSLPRPLFSHHDAGWRLRSEILIYEYRYRVKYESKK